MPSNYLLGPHSYPFHEPAVCIPHACSVSGALKLWEKMITSFSVIARCFNASHALHRVSHLTFHVRAGCGHKLHKKCKAQTDGLRRDASGEPTDQDCYPCASFRELTNRPDASGRCDNCCASKCDRLTCCKGGPMTLRGYLHGKSPLSAKFLTGNLE